MDSPGQIPRKKSDFPISVPLEGFSTGYFDFLTAFRARAAQFGRPVLIVHGDTHTHRIDKPFTGQVGQLFGEAIEDGGFGDGLHPMDKGTGRPRQRRGFFVRGRWPNELRLPVPEALVQGFRTIGCPAPWLVQ